MIQEQLAAEAEALAKKTGQHVDTVWEKFLAWVKKEIAALEGEVDKVEGEKDTAAASTAPAGQASEK